LLENLDVSWHFFPCMSNVCTGFWVLPDDARTMCAGPVGYNILFHLSGQSQPLSPDFRGTSIEA
jgi:hypothetical protein